MNDAEAVVARLVGKHDRQEELRDQISEQQRRHLRIDDGLALALADVKASVDPAHKDIGHQEGQRGDREGTGKIEQGEITLPHDQKIRKRRSQKGCGPCQSQQGM